MIDEPLGLGCWLTYAEKVENIQSHSHRKYLRSQTVLKAGRNEFKYPGHSHDYGQLYDYGEVLNQAVRAAGIK